MGLVAALIYWVIVAIWLSVLITVIVFYRRNPHTFGTTRLLLAVVALDTFRNIFENIYFGLYFGGQYDVLPVWLVTALGHPGLLIVPKLLNVTAGIVVLSILLRRWLPAAVRERLNAENHAETLHALATVDGLTGLFNRRHFLAMADTEWDRFQRYNRQLSMLMVDVDNFKSINDHYGHDVGDRVLARIATACRDLARESDIVGRLGGEEFGVLLPETPLKDAGLFAERLRLAIANIQLNEAGSIIALTVSIGIGAAAHDSSVAVLIKQADTALYDAKHTGRNRVCLFSAALA